MYGLVSQPHHHFGEGGTGVESTCSLAALSRGGCPSVCGSCQFSLVVGAGPTLHARQRSLRLIRGFVFRHEGPPLTARTAVGYPQPPSVILQQPSVILQQPWVILQPPPVTLNRRRYQQPVVSLQPPGLALTDAASLLYCVMSGTALFCTPVSSTTVFLAPAPSNAASPSPFGAPGLLFGFSFRDRKSGTAASGDPPTAGGHLLTAGSSRQGRRGGGRS